MPRKKRDPKKISRELANDEYWEMLLGHGEVDGSVFETIFTKRAAWNLHREELLAVCPAGIRPDAFCQFEHPGMHDSWDEERVEYLRREGLLSPEEEAAIKSREDIRKSMEEEV
ncbi:MAG: hypothetical protein ACOC78_00310 [Actinomycetota bacterium]